MLRNIVVMADINATCYWKWRRSLWL